MKEYSICMACDVKTYNWKRHCNTKKHIAKFKHFQKNILYVEKAVFDSHLVTRFISVNLPKIPWDKSGFKVIKKYKEVMANPVKPVGWIGEIT